MLAGVAAAFSANHSRLRSDSPGVIALPFMTGSLGIVSQCVLTFRRVILLYSYQHPELLRSLIYILSCWLGDTKGVIIALRIASLR